MEQVELLTRSGEFVVTVTVPAFNPPAEIINWGVRVFVRTEAGQYREGMMWVIDDAEWRHRQPSAAPRADQRHQTQAIRSHKSAPL